MKIFVPGRICLFGEHSDWAGGYRRINADIERGYAIIAGTNQGIYAGTVANQVRQTMRNLLDGLEETGLDFSHCVAANVYVDDLTEFAKFREELILDYPDTKITFVEMIVKILPAVLKEYPIVNSSIVGDEVVCWGEYNIGVAVALEDGLIVPVIRDADKLIPNARNDPANAQ